MFDSLDYITDLRNSLDSPVAKSVFDNTVVPFEELDEDAKATLYSMVSALGFIRLYGIDVPVDVAIRLATFSVACVATTIEFHMIHAVKHRAYGLMSEITDMAQSFPERFDEDDLEEGEITSIFHLLMESWAVRAASSRLVPPTSGKLFWVPAEIVLDTKLHNKGLKEVLSSVTSLPLFDNWRKMLVKPYCDDLPWWLDGTLEKVAKKIGDDIDDDEVYSLKRIGSSK